MVKKIKFTGKSGKNINKSFFEIKFKLLKSYSIMRTMVDNLRLLAAVTEMFLILIKLRYKYAQNYFLFKEYTGF